MLIYGADEYASAAPDEATAAPSVQVAFDSRNYTPAPNLPSAVQPMSIPDVSSVPSNAGIGGVGVGALDEPTNPAGVVPQTYAPEPEAQNIDFGADALAHGLDESREARDGATAYIQALNGTQETDRTPEEINAALYYAGSGFGEINSSLRLDREPSEKAADAIAQLDSAMAKSSLPDNVTVYRGMPTELLANLAPGDTITDNGFISTSLSARTAAAFAGPRDTDVVIAQIFVAAGSNGIAPQRGEAEIVLPRGSTFTVVGSSQVTQRFPGVGPRTVIVYQLELK
jgi:hypothetical protein